MTRAIDDDGLEVEDNIPVISLIVKRVIRSKFKCLLLTIIVRGLWPETKREHEFRLTLLWFMSCILLAYFAQFVPSHETEKQTRRLSVTYLLRSQVTTRVGGETVHKHCEA